MPQSLCDVLGDVWSADDVHSLRVLPFTRLRKTPKPDRSPTTVFCGWFDLTAAGKSVVTESVLQQLRFLRFRRVLGMRIISTSCMLSHVLLNVPSIDTQGKSV